MTRDYSYLKNTLSEWKFDLSDKQIEQLDKYYEMLIEKNKVMNLTAITEFDEVLVKHFVDSLSICTVLPNDISSVCDLGTGAGFPGIPMAIAYPSLQFTLIDSLNKRIKFLDEVVSELRLTNVTLVHARAEEAGKNKLYREQFDLVVSRAVANMTTLVEYLLPFVKVGGYAICMKGPEIEEELSKAKFAIKELGGQVEKVENFVLPKADIERNIVIIKKISDTPNKYPRKAGTPSQSPMFHR